MEIQTPRKDLGPDFDPRKRPWYQKAMRNQGKVLLQIRTCPFVPFITFFEKRNGQEEKLRNKGKKGK